MGVVAKYQERFSKSLPFSEIVWEYYRHGISHWRARGEFLDPDVPDDILATTNRLLSVMIVPIIHNEFGVR